MLNKMFFALADENRRHMLKLLSEQQLTVGALAQHFDMTLATVSKNIKILEQGKLIYKVKSGRQVVCHMNYDTWLEVAKFVSMFAQFWNNRLDELENYIGKLEP